MTKRFQLTHRYVETIPKELEEGVLYISHRFNTASHLCCCGCGWKVPTPLNPAKWHLTDHGDSVSLSPSVGLGVLPCHSHYWIRAGRVDWYPTMSRAQTQRARSRDEFDSQVFTGEHRPVEPPHASPSTNPRPWWATLFAWLADLFR